MSETIRQNFLQKACQYLFGKAQPARPQTPRSCVPSC